MTGPRRFDPTELSDDPGALTEAELVGASAMARDLEAIAERDTVPAAGFSDRVMAPIATEPTPKPTRVFGRPFAPAGSVPPSRPSGTRGGSRSAVVAHSPFAVRHWPWSWLWRSRCSAWVAGQLSARPGSSPRTSSRRRLPRRACRRPLRRRRRRPASPSVQPSPSPTPEASPDDTDEPNETPEATATDDSGGNSGPGGGGGGGSGSDDTARTTRARAASPGPGARARELRVGSDDIAPTTRTPARMEDRAPTTRGRLGR
jgi:hypothetical protein